MRKERNSNLVERANANPDVAGMIFKLIPGFVSMQERKDIVDQRFKMMVIKKLSKIESMLIQIQGCQLAKLVADQNMAEQKRNEFLKEVEVNTSNSSHEIGLQMVRYIYAEPRETDRPRDRRRKWTSWEI